MQICNIFKEIKDFQSNLNIILQLFANTAQYLAQNFTNASMKPIATCLYGESGAHNKCGFRYINAVKNKLTKCKKME